jgi:cytoskeletal protein CcmA (bactofilin family)
MAWLKKTAEPFSSEKEDAAPSPPPPRPVPATAPATSPLDNPMTDTRTPSAAPAANHQTLLGGSVVLKGELSANEDLLIEGQFEGSINLKDHCLTVGPHGQVKADINARQVIVNGSVNGKICARDKIEIRRTGNVVGDLTSAGVAIEDGAYFKGSIEILRDEGKAAQRAAATSSGFPAGVAKSG